MKSITPSQCRAARAWLNWSQMIVAKKVGISKSTVLDFETYESAATWGTALFQIFDDAGVKSLFDGSRAIGIEVAERLRQPVYPARQASLSRGCVQRVTGGQVHFRIEQFIAPEQCRAARAWLYLSQQQLAKRSREKSYGTLAVTAIREFEGERPRTFNWDISIATKLFADAGIDLTFDSFGRAKGIRTNGR